MNEFTAQTLPFSSCRKEGKLIRLFVGPFSLRYWNGEIFQLCMGRTEIIHRLHVTQRDAAWNNVPLRIYHEEIKKNEEELHILIEADTVYYQMNMQWQIELHVAKDNNILFSVEALARQHTVVNRAGICLLHPIVDCRGCSVDIDGEAGFTFPLAITPHCIFPPFRRMSYCTESGLKAYFVFSGEKFETEDQRNWTDYSYKTYSPPLAKGYPYILAAGTRLAQSLSIIVEDEKKTVQPHIARPQGVLCRPTFLPSRPLPRLGICLDSESDISIAEIQAKIKPLNLGHMCLVINADSASISSHLHAAVCQAAAAAAPLHICIDVGECPREKIELIACEVLKESPYLREVIIRMSDSEMPDFGLITILQERLKHPYSTLKVGLGFSQGFAGMNRSRQFLRQTDIVNFSISPQVHAYDDASIMETLLGQQEMIAQAVSLCTPTPLSIGPITMKPPPRPIRQGMRRSEWLQCDEARQSSLFGAAWMLGSICSLSVKGVDSLTYFETGGPNGIIGSNRSGSDLPLSGEVSPGYFVLACLRQSHQAAIVPLRWSAPGPLHGFVMHQANIARILLANTSADHVNTLLPYMGESLRIYRLNAATSPLFMSSGLNYFSSEYETITISKRSKAIPLAPYELLFCESMSASDIK